MLHMLLACSDVQLAGRSSSQFRLLVLHSSVLACCHRARYKESFEQEKLQIISWKWFLYLDLMNDRMTALVETPSLPMAHSYSSTTLASTFGRYNSVNRPRRSDTYDQSPQSLSAELSSSLETLAAELTRQLSTSPTGGFSYLSGELYSGHDRRNNFQKSRSVPIIRRHDDEPLKSCVHTDRTVRRTKSVRFADTQGLPLVEAVHQLSSADSSYTENKIVPFTDEQVFARVPLKKAPKHTNGFPSSASSSKGSSKPPSSPKVTSPTHRRRFEFTQPGSEPNFFERVSQEHIVLESVRAESRTLHGTVRVSNLAYDKEICVRWTHDSWRSCHDTNAVFCANDGHTDRFSFELPINGDDVQFALRYRTNGQEFWDNNRGRNYCVISL